MRTPELLAGPAAPFPRARLGLSLTCAQLSIPQAETCSTFARASGGYGPRPAQWRGGAPLRLTLPAHQSSRPWGPGPGGAGAGGIPDCRRWLLCRKDPRDRMQVQLT